MINPGVMQQLEVARQVEFGYYLTDGEDEVLLPNGEMTEDVELDEMVEVFIYNDHQGRLISTMKAPIITKDIFDWVEVVEVIDIGVFIHIGLAKDILVSKDDLPLFEELWPEIGDKLYCSLKEDKNGRLLGKLASDPVIKDISVPANRDAFNRNVKGIIYKTVKVGSYMLTDENLVGFIHESQRKTEPRLGQTIEARIIDVKEDGTVNLSLLPRKHEVMDDDSLVIYEYMEVRGGAMPFWDKSYPEDIEARFNMSKGAFKRALGKLMKENKVYQEDGWTFFTSRK
jgi:uncharacterized protein